MAGGPFSSTFLCFAQKVAWDRRSTPPPYPFNLAIAALAAICSASFCCVPCRGGHFPVQIHLYKEALVMVGALLAGQAVL